MRVHIRTASLRNKENSYTPVNVNPSLTLQKWDLSGVYIARTYVILMIFTLMIMLDSVMTVTEARLFGRVVLKYQQGFDPMHIIPILLSLTSLA